MVAFVIPQQSPHREKGSTTGCWKNGKNLDLDIKFLLLLYVLMNMFLKMYNPHFSYVYYKYKKANLIFGNVHKL